MYKTVYQKTLSALLFRYRSCTGAVRHSAPFRLMYVTLYVSWANTAEPLCTVELQKRQRNICVPWNQEKRKRDKLRGAL